MAQNLSIVPPFSAPARAPGQRVSFQFWRQPVYELADGTYWSPGCAGNTYFDNDPWSYVLVGGVKTPGFATVEVHKYGSVDRKKAAGSTGEHLTAHGLAAAEVEINVMVWTPEQLRQLQLFWQSFFLQPWTVATVATTSSGTLNPVALTNPINLFAAFTQPAPQASKINTTMMVFDAQHPTLSDSGVKSIMFTGNEAITLDKNGRGTFRMHALEFARPSPPTKTVTRTPVQSLSSLLDPGATTTTPSGYAAPPWNDPNNLGPR